MRVRLRQRCSNFPRPTLCSPAGLRASQPFCGRQAELQPSVLAQGVFSRQGGGRAIQKASSLPSRSLLAKASLDAQNWVSIPCQEQKPIAKEGRGRCGLHPSLEPTEGTQVSVGSCGAPIPAAWRARVSLQHSHCVRADKGLGWPILPKMLPTGSQMPRGIQKGVVGRRGLAPETCFGLHT